MRLKVFAAFCLTLLLAAVCAVPGDPARAQRTRRGRQTTPAPNAAAPQQPERPKNIIVGRGSDTARGSRMTITSDEALNDYSAYRSGDRFYVELPNANAATAARAAGKGFSDMQVQRRGKSVVLSYRVQPGAKPRVEQRFNRLEVVFEVPEGEAARTAAQTPQQPAPQPTQATASQNQTPQNRATGETAPSAAQNAAGDRRTPAGNAPTGQTVAAQPVADGAPAGVIAQPPAGVPQPSPAEQSPSPAAEQPSPAAGQPGANEIAQAQRPAPVERTNTATGAAGSGTSVGAFLLRNWTLVLVAALLLVGIGLLIAARRTSAPPRTPADEAAALGEVPAPRLKGADAAVTSGQSGAAVAASLAAATATAARELEGSKKSKKSKKSKAAEVVREKEKTPAAARAAGPAAEPVPALPTPEVAPVETAAGGVTAGETTAEGVAVGETTAAEVVAVETAKSATSEVATSEVAPVVVAGASSAVGAQPETAAEQLKTETAAGEPQAVTAAEEAKAVTAAGEVLAEVTPQEVKGIVAAAPLAAESKAVVPVASLDPDRAQAETKLLLEGGDYDRGVLSTKDAMARQLIASELLSALAGRNAERRERARAAFVEHGYFDEKADDLRTAEAAAERASAARALGLAAGLAATPHLVAALEDEAVEVRRAAVESLASLRDPSAVAPLEALLRREKKSKTKVNRKLVEHAVQTCREGVAEPPATVAAPAVETIVESAAVAPSVAPSADETAAAPTAEAVTVDESAAVEAPAGVAEPVHAEEIPAVRESATAETPTPVAETATEIETVEVAPVTAAADVSPVAGELTRAEEAGWSSPAVEEVAATDETPGVEERPAAEAPWSWTQPVEEAARPSFEEHPTVGEGRAPAAAEEGVEVGAGRVGVGEEGVEEEASAASPAGLFESASPAGLFEHAPTAEVSPPVAAEAGTFESATGALEASSPAVEEVAASPHVVGARPAVEEDAEVSGRQGAEVGEPAAEPVAEAASTGFESFVEPAAEVSAPAGGVEVEEARVERGGEWVELDMSELGAATSTASAAPVIETSGGEAMAPAPYAGESFTREPAAVEPAEFEPTTAEPSAVESSRAESPFAASASGVTPFEELASAESPVDTSAEGRGGAAPSFGAAEKGVAPFDEYSSVPANIQQRLASREPAERAAAVAELARVDTGESFQQVCAAFDDEAKEVRSAAARALYDMPGDRAESFTRALREASAERRRNIGASISSSGLASEAIGQLTGESREKTYEAFSLLFLMAKAGEVQALVRAIEGHPNNEVRLAVVKLLALSGQKEILPAFRRLAVRGSLPTEVRSAVMEAIYQISSQSETTPAA